MGARALRVALSGVTATWRRARLAKVALGKYIILLACLLHLGWAVLLLADSGATAATGVHTLSIVCGGPFRTSFVLVCVALAAIAFPFLRERVSNKALAGMLIPQQLMLLISAGGALAAVFNHHYADGVMRTSTFILTDQLPLILLAFLYTVAVLEAAFSAE